MRATYTENYGFKKPENEDFFDVKDFCDMMDSVDTELKKHVYEEFSKDRNGLVPAPNTEEKRYLNSRGDWTSPALEAYPVGAIYLSVNDTNPSILFGGSWSVFAKGRVLVGVDAEQTEFNAAEKTGGAKTHTLSTAQIPSHTHAKGTLVNNTTGNHRHEMARKNGAAESGKGTVAGPYSYTNIGDPDVVTCLTEKAGDHNHTISGSTAATGSGGPHNNLQPYIACFMWKRTA